MIRVERITLPPGAPGQACHDCGKHCRAGEFLHFREFDNGRTGPDRTIRWRFTCSRCERRRRT